ncbi:MAG TPA: endonuclease/exonuclease/phosphatase family protein [Opitutus sp.]|nr:endonuclease/exonuclease/phosphatase family protein [Opitutus sp.]
MRRALLALLAAGVLLPAMGRGETLTIATYNVENYDATNRMTPEGYRKDYPKPEAQKRALRAVIRAVDADVIALQEMGTLPYLQELQRDLKAEGVDYPHALLLDGPDEVRHVAILSRRAFTSVAQHATLTFPYFGAPEKVKRGLLEVRLATADGELTIFTLHLKSRYTDRPDDPRSALRRVGEAVAVRDAVLREFPEPARARFVIAGDFNDDKASKPVQRMLERGKTVVAELLPAADARGETWTHNYRKEDNYTRVDHILVSPWLAGAVRGGTARIYDGPGVREASDHRPVVVTLELGGGK